MKNKTIIQDYTHKLGASGADTRCAYYKIKEK
jgi:hypothetical protein